MIEEKNKNEALPTEAEETAAQADAVSEADKTEARTLEEEYRRFGIEGGDEESMNSIADMLSTFQEEEDGAVSEKAGKHSDLAKKKRLIPILGICAVIGVVLYYAVLAPLLNITSEEEAEIPAINTWLNQQVEEGNMTDAERTALLNAGKCEVLGTSNRVLMFNHVEKASIQSIEVHNDYGVYTFYRDASDEFAILGAERCSYDKELLSSLVVSAGYTLSMTRVAEICEDMSEYGLSEEDNPSYYTLTTTAGVTHTVYIGNMIPTGAGYYCKYEDRPAVYVLDSSLASTLLADVRDMMTAILSYPVSSTTYYTITNFVMEKNGEEFLAVNYMSDAERAATASTSIWEMVYPEGGYTPSMTNYDAMLQSFISFVGDRVVEFNVLGTEITEEITDEQYAMLEKYGLVSPETTITFDYTDSDQGYTVTNALWFSAKTENDTYYVYSWLFDIIGEISASSCSFLSYDLIDFIDESVFQMNIDNVEYVEITGDGTNANFHLVGEGQELIVTDKISGYVPETKNFRQLYKTMLSIEIEDYTEDDTESEETLLATMKITTRAGIETEYKFYAYSTRRCYMTINGEGEFYVLRDQIKKLLSDTEKVLTGVTVSYDARS